MPIEFHIGFAFALTLSLFSAAISMYQTGAMATVSLVLSGLCVVINPILWRIAARSWPVNRKDTDETKSI